MGEQQFPVYRRYLNGKNYFRIDSLQAFEELRSLGPKWMLEQHEVRILPDRNFVHDLLHEFSTFAEEISAEEYESVRRLAL